MEKSSQTSISRYTHGIPTLTEFRLGLIFPLQHGAHIFIKYWSRSKLHDEWVLAMMAQMIVM